MPPTTQQRRDEIVGEVLKNGHVAVRSLARRLEVSEATVRRDLRSLADAGQLDLVYGGATLPRSSDFSFLTKARRNVAAKRRIGRLAAGLVQDHDTVFLDSGTTIYEMVPHLRARRGLTIIVNSMRFAVELGAAGSANNVIVVGGQYRPERMDTVGAMAHETLEQLRGFRAFVGADGLSAEFGITACDIESAHLYKLAIRNAREAILLVDHTKFLSPSLFKICELDDVSRIVTDCRPADSWVDCLNERGIDLLYPEDEQDGLATEAHED